MRDSGGSQRLVTDTPINADGPLSTDASPRTTTASGGLRGRRRGWSARAWKRHAPDWRGRKLTKVNPDRGGISPKATVDLLVRRLEGAECHHDAKSVLDRMHAQEDEAFGRAPSGCQPLLDLLLKGDVLLPSPLRHVDLTEDGQDVLPLRGRAAEPYSAALHTGSAESAPSGSPQHDARFMGADARASD